MTVRNFMPNPPSQGSRKSKESHHKGKSEKIERYSLLKEIEINEEKLLGKGSGGTCVFEGRLHGRIVAVKRMLH